MSIRYRLHDDPDHPYSEAIGVVQSVVGAGAGTRIRILSRRGRVVEVAVAEVLAAKVFPA